MPMLRIICWSCRFCCFLLPDCIMPRTLPIILFISPHCLMSWFTSCTERPEPLAMRERRMPLMSLGRARSSLVME